jgi:beta-1,4-mannosyltransferase
MLVQNPPSIPTLAIAFTVCFLRNTHLIIDWHNYGFTILAGTKGVSHPVVKISKTYEQLLGRCAPTLNLTVTDAMARDLRGEGWGIRSPILVMHDRPAGIFRPIESNAERRAFLEKLEETKDHADDIMAGKTRLLVSSTSWTPDEDFGLLLDALVAYASSRRQSRPPSGALPPILAIITGKGPQKESYLARIAALTAQGKLQGVTVQTAFLSLPDYALLLACADLGVCLHKSSSGVDLPMKVVDMFGCGLPVAGYSAYPSWPELVTEGVNGRGFVDSEGLMKVLVDLFGKGKGELDVLRLGAIEEGRRRWDGEWEGVVGRVLGLVE